MKTFVIDSANRVKAYASRDAARRCRDGTAFRTDKDFAAATHGWAMDRLVAIWNKLPGVTPVRKFTNRNTALRRIWTLLQTLEPQSEPSTKLELVIRLLKKPSGATLKDIMTATGWQAHSVRAFISATLPKKLGVRVISTREEGERVYRIR
jgi:hypothetical protein